MGCSSANIIDDKIKNLNNPNNETSSLLTIKSNKKKDVYKIKRKGRPDDDDSIIQLSEKEQLEQIAKEEIEILNQFNSKYNNNEGITLASLSQYYLHSNKENTNIISLSSNEKIIKCLKNINPFDSNLDENNDINLLKSKLVQIETNHPKLIKPVSPLFHLNLTQVIHQDYEFKFKLKNVITNEYKMFEFNQLDRPILFIFFDILSLEAINKIKEFREYEKELLNDNNHNFLLIPIMNIFVQEKENLYEQKKYLESINITEDCYILTQPINSSFIKLFELDCVTQSKCIIINRNSEISLILEDHIEFLTREMINFYLNTRNSEYTNDYFNNENKEELKNILQKDEFKKILENFSQNFNLEIEFKEIENKKYPVNIRFMYHQKDTKNAEKILNKLEYHLKNKIKKYFIGQNVIKDKKESLLGAMDYLKQKVSDEYIIDNINKKIKISNSSFILTTQSSCIYNNNDITKNKKYILKYYLNDLSKFNQILEIFSSNLYTNPQFSQLNCGHSIVPKTGMELNPIIENCREVKLFTDKNNQLKFQSNNKDIKFNLQENKIENIILINPNIFLNNNEQKEKIKNIFDTLDNKKINFIICVFSYNELDAQKLRYLSWDKIYSSPKSTKKSKKNKIKDKNIEKEKEKENKYFKIIYLNSTLPQNYYTFGYYTEDLTIKMIHISESCQVINFYDLDIYNLSDIQNSTNIYDYLDKEKKENEFFEGNDNNNYEKELKVFKKSKKDIKNYVLGNKNITKWKNYKLTVLNFSLVYNKYLIFEDDIKFNNYKSKYNNININITYLDYLKQNLNLEKIYNILESNNKNSCFEISLKETELTTINLFPKLTKTFVCSKCLKSYPFHNESFYMCYSCKTIDYLLCKYCYDELYLNAKGNNEEDDFFKDFIMNDKNNDIKDNEKDNEEENMLYTKIHEHPLLFLFNFDAKKNTYMIKDIYEKYIDILTNGKNKKLNKSDIKICSICSNYLFEDAKNINVLVSHIKTKTDYSPYSKPYEEVFICNECFETNEYQNVILKEENDNNFIILSMLNE